MQVVEISISRLKNDPNQARIHGERNLEAIKQSLEKFGQQHPIVVGRGNIILAGNGRVAAAKALGWKKIKAVRTKLTGKEAIAYALADNRTGELADWDVDALSFIAKNLITSEELEELTTGFSIDELTALAEGVDVKFSTEGGEKKLDEEFTKSGKKVECPNCGQEFTI